MKIKKNRLCVAMNLNKFSNATFHQKCTLYEIRKFLQKSYKLQNLKKLELEQVFNVYKKGYLGL